MTLLVGMTCGPPFEKHPRWWKGSESSCMTSPIIGQIGELRSRGGKGSVLRVSELGLQGKWAIAGRGRCQRQSKGVGEKLDLWWLNLTSGNRPPLEVARPLHFPQNPLSDLSQFELDALLLAVESAPTDTDPSFHQPALIHLFWENCLWRKTLKASSKRLIL